MKFTIPNFLSVLRMGLVPLFIIAVIDGDSRKALLIFVVAGVTDALDGLIARLANQHSLLGAYLDPIADKLLLTSAYIALSIPQLNHGAPIPLWVTVLVIARDLLIVVMALIMYLAAGVRRFPLRSSARSTRWSRSPRSSSSWFRASGRSSSRWRPAWSTASPCSPWPPGSTTSYGRASCRGRPGSAAQSGGPSWGPHPLSPSPATPPDLPGRGGTQLAAFVKRRT